MRAIHSLRNSPLRARNNGMSYSRFISGLKKAGIEVNRKMLADLAVRDASAFGRLVERARENLKA